MSVTPSMFRRFVQRVGPRAAACALGAPGAAYAAALCEASPPPASASIASSSGSESTSVGRAAQLERAAWRDRGSSLPMVVISPTFYPRVDDTRCQLGIEACRRAKALGIRLLLVDASPPEVKAALTEAGAIVREQARAGKKGAALRECVEIALTMLPRDGVICYQELEKVEMVALQRELCAHMLSYDSDVCVAGREDSLFRRSYPIEQYHQETFANLYLNSLGSAAGLPTLDWTFGPVAFRTGMAHHWLRFGGELWDAQIVPYINAAREGARIDSLVVNYSHPPLMKREEEHQPAWSEKRLMQLNFLFKHIGEPLKCKAP